MICSTTINYECGKKTCAIEPGKFCRFVAVGDILGQKYLCTLFRKVDEVTGTIEFQELVDVDGWFQRCPQCLNGGAEI